VEVVADFGPSSGAERVLGTGKVGTARKPASASRFLHRCSITVTGRVSSIKLFRATGESWELLLLFALCLTRRLRVVRPELTCQATGRWSKRSACKGVPKASIMRRSMAQKHSPLECFPSADMGSKLASMVPF
jgi:hypothetical protein